MFNDELLVGSSSFSHLFVFNFEGRQLLDIAIQIGDLLKDAAWTPRDGNIVYSAKNKRVVVMSKSGEIIATHPQFTKPQYLSTSNDNTIYLADFNAGIYQSIDDGINWSLVFESSSGWLYLHAIKVTNVQGYNFCTLETKYLDSPFLQLRLYSVDKTSSSSNVSWANIDIISADGKLIDLSFSKLSYGGHAIFLNDYKNEVLYTLSLYGPDNYKLPPWYIGTKPSVLTFDYNQERLYVGYSSGKVGLFNTASKKCN